MTTPPPPAGNQRPPGAPKRSRDPSTNLGAPTSDKRRRKISRAPQQCFLTTTTLDVVFEIFSYLEPLDILHLSRTCRDVREILMERSSAFLWRTVRCNFEPRMPELPSDITEVGYAYLAFSTLCHVCLRVVTERVIWECRIRCCRNCFGSTFVSDTNLHGDESFYILSSNGVSHLVPRAAVPGGRKKFLFRKAINRLATELQQVKNKGEDELKKWKFTKELQKKAMEEHAAQCEEWVEVMRQHRGIEHWKRLQVTKRQRDIEHEEIWDQRFNFIKDRIKGTEWGEEFQRLDSNALAEFKRLQGVRTPYVLKEKGWACINPVVVEFLLQHQLARWVAEEKRRYSMLMTRYIQYKRINRGIGPSLGDIVMSQEFKAIIEGTSFDQVLSDEAFNPAFSRLQVLTHKWSIEKEVEVFAILRHSVPEAHNIEDISRATSVFKCNALNCGLLLFYPDMLQHPCTTSCSFRAADGSSELGGQNSVSYPFAWVGCQPWNQGKNRVVFCKSASRIAMQILKLSKLHPNSTVSQVEQWNPAIMCVTCQRFMLWKEALQHDDSHSLASVGRAILRSDPWGMPHMVPYDISCSTCGTLVRPDLFSQHLFSQHLSFRHNIQPSDWTRSVMQAFQF